MVKFTLAKSSSVAPMACNSTPFRFLSHFCLFFDDRWGILDDKNREGPEKNGRTWGLGYPEDFVILNEGKISSMPEKKHVVKTSSKNGIKRGHIVSLKGDQEEEEEDMKKFVVVRLGPSRATIHNVANPSEKHLKDYKDLKIVEKKLNKQLAKNIVKGLAAPQFGGSTYPSFSIDKKTNEVTYTGLRPVKRGSQAPFLIYICLLRLLLCV
jgi:hypothetical protein